MKLLELNELLTNDAQAIKYLQDMNIIHSNRLCVNGHDMVLSVTEKSCRWRCNRRECRKEVGVRVGTWFSKSRLSLKTIVLFIYCWSNGLSQVWFLRRELCMGEAAI